jgi:hypothetical protein
MTDKDRSKHSAVDASSDSVPLQRREVMKGVALGAGMFASAKWAKPIVETVALPAHATATPGQLIGRNQGAGGSSATQPEN